MNQEERDLLADILANTRENNKILTKMQRNARWATTFQVVRWTVVILIALGAYYYVQPYVDRIIATYRNVTGTVSSMNDKATTINAGLKSVNDIVNSIRPSTTTKAR